tara:strand:- start:11342 stop:11578 length:237 start_codon:yes stop_codon:yes gene_type:complete
MFRTLFTNHKLIDELNLFVSQTDAERHNTFSADKIDFFSHLSDNVEHILQMNTPLEVESFYYKILKKNTFLIHFYSKI